MFKKVALTSLWSKRPKIQATKIYSAIIFVSLMALETFNFVTVLNALKDFFGPQGVMWAWLLGFALWAIDAAGVSKLFSLVAETKQKSRSDIWYLLGIWALAALTNTALRWWSITQALFANPELGNELVSREELITVIPVLATLLVLMIRIFLIGTFTLVSPKLTSDNQPSDAQPEPPRT